MNRNPRKSVHTLVTREDLLCDANTQRNRGKVVTSAPNGVCEESLDANGRKVLTYSTTNGSSLTYIGDDRYPKADPVTRKWLNRLPGHKPFHDRPSEPLISLNHEELGVNGRKVAANSLKRKDLGGKDRPSSKRVRARERGMQDQSEMHAEDIPRKAVGRAYEDSDGNRPMYKWETTGSDGLLKSVTSLMAPTTRHPEPYRFKRSGRPEEELTYEVGYNGHSTLFKSPANHHKGKSTDLEKSVHTRRHGDTKFIDWDPTPSIAKTGRGRSHSTALKLGVPEMSDMRETTPGRRGAIKPTILRQRSNTLDDLGKRGHKVEHEAEFRAMEDRLQESRNIPVSNQSRYTSNRGRCRTRSAGLDDRNKGSTHRVRGGLNQTPADEKKFHISNTASDMSRTPTDERALRRNTTANMSIPVDEERGVTTFPYPIPTGSPKSQPAILPGISASDMSMRMERMEVKEDVSPSAPSSGRRLASDPLAIESDASAFGLLAITVTVSFCAYMIRRVKCMRK